MSLFCIRSKNRPLCFQVRPVNEQQLALRRAQRDHNAFVEQIELHVKDDLAKVLTKLRSRLRSKANLLANAQAQKHCHELIEGIDQSLDIQQVLRICKIIGISSKKLFATTKPHTPLF